MLEILNTYDWEEAFGEGTGGNTTRFNFSRYDVKEILLAREGEPDGIPWIFVGKLYNGQYVHLEAGCDYTGWDCQASNFATVYPDYSSMLAGVGDEVRDLLGTPSDLQKNPTLSNFKIIYPIKD